MFARVASHGSPEGCGGNREICKAQHCTRAHTARTSKATRGHSRAIGGARRADCKETKVLCPIRHTLFQKYASFQFAVRSSGEPMCILWRITRCDYRRHHVRRKVSLQAATLKAVSRVSRRDPTNLSDIATVHRSRCSPERALAWWRKAQFAKQHTHYLGLIENQSSECINS